MSTSPLSTPLPWNLVADAYATDITPAFETYARAALALAAPPAGGRVADVGCGPGTLALLASNTGLSVSALDFSPEMVRLARARFEAAGQDPDRVQEGDGQALPWPDGAFDAAFSMFALIFFPDRERGLRELRRVVRPGGSVVVASWVPVEEIPQFRVLFTAMGELLPPGPPPPPPVMPTEAAIQAEFAAAGFAGVRCHRVTHGLSAPDAEAWFAGMSRSLAPLALMRHHMGAGWPAFEGALRARVVAGLGEGPVSVEMTAWLAVARVAAAQDERP